MKPYHLLESRSADIRLATGTTHGSPFEYDTHVPLLVYGPGVTGGVRAESVTPQHCAAIGAHFLGTKSPRDAEYGLPKTLTRK